ncbi:MAG: DUF6179 domain-containing protein [Lachnospiraceae bacterium]|nr:DUF6179 domain-containing protein [Lachnospiraceae bacterium]
MKYEMEELVPIVAKLAEGYTSKESTSITYDKAQQLMGAVLYSIHEGEKAEHFSLVQKDEMPLERMYTIGAKCVEEKTKETLNLYNEIMTHFSSYENKCLNDTVVKGLPEFFKWYDCKYEPQNTILTLDYPILVDLSEYTGIDKIYDYILCIQMEQKFLNKFSSEYVMEILSKYDKQYRLIIDNICEIVPMNVISHILAGKNISILNFEPEEYLKMQALIQTENLSDLRGKLKNAVNVLIREYYENDEKLMDYLYKAVDNISVRIKSAADNGNLHRIL